MPWVRLLVHPMEKTRMSATVTRPRAPGWMDRTACKDVDPAIFHPAAGSEKPALRVCAACLVQPECLAAELTFGVAAQYGIRGGATAEERRRMLRGSRETRVANDD
jgi:hypothetical protein